ncbi:MAG: peptidase M48 [Acinetobacter sp.]|jgi:Zn-dependent protease with chaperone function|nr:MAG: peptidase M48 [Acinetobacter sp.]
MQKKNAIKLFCYFSIAILIAVAILNFIFGLLAYFFDHSQAIGWHVLSPYIVIFLFLLITGSLLFKWWRYKGNGQTIAEYHQASQLHRHHALPEEMIVLDLNEGLAEECGVSPAHLYVLYDELGINALTVGYAAQDVSIILTWGALQSMNPDELKGMLAHEYCQILSNRYKEHTHLEVLLAGCLTISQIGSYLIVRGTKRKVLAIDSIFAAIYLALGGFIWLLGSVGILTSRILKFMIFYRRQLEMDVNTCELVEQQYLLHALTRIYVHDRGSHIYRVESESIAHYCFANPLNEQSWFTVHPSLSQRIKNLHPYFGRRTVQKSELNWQRFIARILLPTSEEALLDTLDVQQHKDTTSLASLRLFSRHFVAKDAVKALHPDIRASMERPELLLRAMQTATGCREVIIAIFMIRQYRTLIPEDLAVSQAIIDALLKLDGRVYVQIFNEALKNIGHMPTISSRQFLARITQIIQADHEITFLDCLLLEKIKAEQGLLEDATPVARANCVQAIVHIVDAALHVQQVTQHNILKLRHKILKQLLSYAELQQYLNITDQPLDLAHSLRLISGLLVRERLYILIVLENEIWSERMITQDELDMMQILYWRFGFDSQDIVHRMLKKSSALIF